MSRSREPELVGSRDQLAVTALQLGPQATSRSTSPAWAASAANSRSSTDGERQAGALLQPEHAQQLPAVPHGQRPPTRSGRVPGVGSQARERSSASSASRGHDGRQRQAAGDHEPDLCPLRPGALGEQRAIRAGSSSLVAVGAV